jgi:hypothetical protein
MKQLGKEDDLRLPISNCRIPLCTFVSFVVDAFKPLTTKDTKETTPSAAQLAIGNRKSAI